MTASASVSIDRTSLSLSPLLIAHNGTTFRVSEDGIGRPGKTWRFGDMPNNGDIHGTEHVSASLEESSLPLKVFVKGSTTAALEAALDELEAALGQFEFEATVTVAGVARTWLCSAGSSQASLDSGEAAAHVSTVNVTIPVYPIPS